MVRKKRLNVVCAIFYQNGKILAFRRKTGEKMAGKWEFPGGKIRQGETPDQSIIREIREELDLEILPEKSFPPIEHEYPEFLIKLFPYLCRWEKGELRLHVHDECRWLDKTELESLDWSDADRAVLALMKNWL